MRVGVAVTSSQLPPATQNIYSTANAFMIGRGDSGLVGTAVKCYSINDVAKSIGARSATNSALYDAADTYFREGGSIVYLSRVVGPTPVNATRTLQDAVPHPTVVVTALTPGLGANALKVAVTVVSTNYTVTIQDSSGNVLETFGPFANASGNAPLLASVSQYVAFTQSAGSGFTTAAPQALAAAALSSGADDYGNITLTQITNALTAFTAMLGPGQVSAPGITNTTLNGIWSALGTHAQNNNRVAPCDMNDLETAAAVVADLASFGTSGVGSYCGFWAGNVTVPGVTGGTNRTVAPSPVISALCARADQLGNPNLAAAGDSFPLKYVNGFTGSGGNPLYGQADIDTLNLAGVNTWNTVFGVPQNYGFVSPVSPTNDAVYWQFNHARLRMAIIADAQVIGQPFVFSQISAVDIRAFAGDLATMLKGYRDKGALFQKAHDGSVDQGFVVDTGASVNTPTTIQAGQLNANLSVRMAPFSQLININVNVVPVSQNL